MPSASCVILGVKRSYTTAGWSARIAAPSFKKPASACYPRPCLLRTSTALSCVDHQSHLALDCTMYGMFANYLHTNIMLNVPHRLQMHLNLDVLGLICSSLTERADVLSFSATCSALRLMAAGTALSMGPIVIHSEQTVRKLHAFVFADLAGRAPHIHALDISARISSLPIPTRESMAVIADQFIALLDYSRSLAWLQLSINEQPFLRHASVLSAIARLRSLRTLTIQSCNNNLPSWLHTLQSPLTALSIADYHGSPRTLALVASSIARFAPSLVCLKLARLQFTLLPIPVIQTFTTLRSLTLDHTEGLPELDTLISLFPNLDTLSWGVMLHHSPDHALTSARNRNHQVQERQAWRYLHWVACETEMLYALGLSCPIRHLIVDNSPAGLWNDILAKCLLDNAPMCLRLSMQVEDFDTEGPEQLQKMFPMTGSVLLHLTHLVLFLPYDTSLLSPQHCDPQEIWDRLIVSWHATNSAYIIPLMRGNISAHTTPRDQAPASHTSPHRSTNLSLTECYRRAARAVPRSHGGP